MYGSFAQEIDKLLSGTYPLFCKINTTIIMRPLSVKESVLFLSRRLSNPTPHAILTYFSICGGIVGFYAHMKNVLSSFSFFVLNLKQHVLDADPSNDEEIMNVLRFAKKLYESEKGYTGQLTPDLIRVLQKVTENKKSKYSELNKIYYLKTTMIKT
jgi:hypothetical protein